MLQHILSMAIVLVFAAPIIVSANDDVAVGETYLSLDNLVVTTRKREEVLQNIPVAITAFPAQLIEDADLQNIEDIALMTPGFTFSPLFGGRLGNPVIRGASTTIGEPNVGSFLDGVYQEARGAMEAMFGDELERIEIAKGPQSALYGRNTFSGAVNYVTKQPSNDTEGQLEVTLGNEGRKDMRFSHSGAITEDSLFYRIGAMHSGFDGFYKNELNNSKLDHKQSNLYSLSLIALPTDDLEIIFRIGVENTNDGDDALQFVDNNSDYTNNILITLPPGSLSPNSPAFPIRFNDFQNFSGNLPSITHGFAVSPGHIKRDNTTSSFRVNWDFDTVTFTSITGYNDLKFDNAIDTDYSATAIRFEKTKTEQDEFSQEFRLTSVEQSIDWMVGAYFYDMDRDIHTLDAYQPNAPLNFLATSVTPSIEVQTNEGTRNWAAFGSAGFELNEQLTLTLSGRYAYEKKEVNVLDKTLDGGLSGTAGTFKDSVIFNNFTPKVTLDYHWLNNFMIYSSVAKAVKSGGFNTLTSAGLISERERTYDSEKSLNYEVGFKSSWLDNRVTANLAIFYIKWGDQIVRALGDSGAVLNINAGESTSKGFELEIAAKPAKNWDIMAGLSYTDSGYDKYFFEALARLDIDPVNDGNRMQFSSKWTANTSIQYTKPRALADFDWTTRLDAMYESNKTTLSIDDAPLLPARSVINLRSGIKNNKYSFTFWVKNLLNNDAPISAVAITNPSGIAGFNPLNPTSGYQRFQELVQAPFERTYGITARVKF